MMKLCCIFNTPSLYREAIYKKIDENYDCNWFFENTDNKLKMFDLGQFKLQDIYIRLLLVHFIIRGILKLVFNI